MRNRGAGSGACVCDHSGDGVESLPEGGINTGGRDRGAGLRTFGGNRRGRGVVRCCDGNVGQVERGVTQAEAGLVLH